MTAPEVDAPLVSCVTIFLNGERYIAAAIDSVLAQSWPNWELILVDDGSTDGATAIARGFAERHPDRIRYIEHPGHENRGMSASRNAGIAAAQGEMIAFLDADDIWLPERLSRHAAELARRPEVAMTVSPTLYWSSWKAAEGVGGRPWLKVDLIQDLGLPAGVVIAPPAAAIHYLETGGDGVPGVCSVTIRREALLAVGGADAAFRGLYEDQVLFFKMFLEHASFVIDERLDLYRQHADSACWQAAKVGGDVAARARFFDWLQDHVRERGLSGPDLDRALGEALARAGAGDGARRGALADVKARWSMEARLFANWALTPPVYESLRRRFAG